MANRGRAGLAITVFVILLAIATVAHSLYSQLRMELVLKDVELNSSSSLISTISYPGMTATSCVSLCLISAAKNCSVLSFRRLSGQKNGTCKLGRNATDTVTSTGSKLYAIRSTKTSTVPVCLQNPNAPPYPANATYTRVALNHTLIGEARQYCVQNDLGNLAVTYPMSNASFAALMQLLQPGDVVFVDIIRVRNKTQPTFATGLGVTFNAASPLSDPCQRWAPNQPNAASDDDGLVVVLRKDDGGWDDVSVSDGAVNATAVVCVQDGYPYRFIPSTGKYYRIVTNVANQSAARALCIQSGGNLAITLSVGGKFDFSDIYNEGGNFYWVDGFPPTPGNSWIWQFYDGTLIDYSNPTNGSGRIRGLTMGLTFPAFTTYTAGCLTLYAGHILDGDCSVESTYICERGNLTAGP